MNDVTLLTPAGRGAVAVLRIRGIGGIDESPSLFAAANQQALSDQPLGRVCFGQWGTTSPEDVVICRIEEDVCEIHCHGGTAAVRRIAGDLKDRGYHPGAELFPSTASDVQNPIPPLSLTDRAGIEAECRRALIRATTLRTADHLWQQCECRLADALVAVAASPPAEARQQAQLLLQWADFARHLTVPWRVVLFGRPNVGKSSLINAIAGFSRSIVFDQPGTTRDVVTVETALDGWPIELSDTAGLRDDADVLEAAGITRARQRVEEAELRILLVDVSCPLTEEDQRLLAEWPDAIRVAHKCDLPRHDHEGKLDSALPVSSLSGSGLDSLCGAITDRLVPVPPPPDTLLPVTPVLTEALRTIVLRD